MRNEPDALAFRNQLDALCLNFVADFKRRDARACAEDYTEDAVERVSRFTPFGSLEQSLPKLVKDDEEQAKA